MVPLLVELIWGVVGVLFTMTWVWEIVCVPKDGSHSYPARPGQVNVRC